jgi:hypothetical protein
MPAAISASRTTAAVVAGFQGDVAMALNSMARAAASRRARFRRTCLLVCPVQKPLADTRTAHLGLAGQLRSIGQAKASQDDSVCHGCGFGSLQRSQQRVI